jgi:hypothetical protein
MMEPDGPGSEAFTGCGKTNYLPGTAISMESSRPPAAIESYFEPSRGKAQ